MPFLKFRKLTSDFKNNNITCFHIGLQLGVTKTLVRTELREGVCCYTSALMKCLMCCCCIHFHPRPYYCSVVHAYNIQIRYHYSTIYIRGLCINISLFFLYICYGYSTYIQIVLNLLFLLALSLFLLARLIVPLHRYLHSSYLLFLTHFFLTHIPFVVSTTITGVPLLASHIYLF